MKETVSTTPNHTAVKVAFPVLLGILLLQIPFRYFYFEPYPSLVMPGGSSIMRVDSTVSYQAYDLRVEDRDGRMHAVTTSQVLPGLPGQFHGAVLGAHFGLREQNARTSPGDARAARTWLRARLRDALGEDVRPRSIHVRRIEVARNVRPGGAAPDTSLLSSGQVSIVP